jgi:hypothetical protein
MITSKSNAVDVDLVVVIEATLRAIKHLGQGYDAFQSSYAQVGSKVSDIWGAAAVQVVIPLIREYRVISVAPAARPQDIDCERTIIVRVPLDEIPFLAQSIARGDKVSLIDPRTIMGGAYRIVNPFADEIIKRREDRSRRKNEEQEEEAGRRDEELKYLVRGWADGYCQGCDREVDHLDVFKSGQHPVHSSGWDYASEPHHLIALCPECHEVLKRWYNGAQRPSHH